MAPGGLSISVEIRRVWLAVLWLRLCLLVQMVSPGVTARMAGWAPRLLQIKVK